MEVVSLLCRQRQSDANGGALSVLHAPLPRAVKCEARTADVAGDLSRFYYILPST